MAASGAQGLHTEAPTRHGGRVLSALSLEPRSAKTDSVATFAK